MLHRQDDFSIPGISNAFGLPPSPYNFVQPFKRPLSSSVPTIVEYNGEVEYVIGASGGSRIITSTLQTLINMIDFGKSAVEAEKEPRIHHQLLPNEVRWFNLIYIVKINFPYLIGPSRV